MEDKVTGVAEFTIDPQQQAQTFKGWGTCFNELGWDALNLLPQDVQDQFMSRMFEDSGLAFHELFTSTPAVFIHHSHPLAAKASVTFQDLEPYPCIMYALDADAPSILHEEFLAVDFYPQKVNIISDLYQSLQVMTTCGGYDLGIGVIAPSNKALGIEKRPIEGFDQPISIGWICQKSYTPSPLAAKFVENLKLLSVDQ